MGNNNNYNRFKRNTRKFYRGQEGADTPDRPIQNPCKRIHPKDAPRKLFFRDRFIEISKEVETKFRLIPPSSLINKKKENSAKLRTISIACQNVPSSSQAIKGFSKEDNLNNVDKIKDKDHLKEIQINRSFVESKAVPFNESIQIYQDMENEINESIVKSLFSPGETPSTSFHQSKIFPLDKEDVCRKTFPKNQDTSIIINISDSPTTIEIGSSPMILEGNLPPIHQSTPIVRTEKPQSSKLRRDQIIIRE